MSEPITYQRPCKRCGVWRRSTAKRWDGEERCDECEAAIAGGEDDVEPTDVWEDDGE